MTKKMDFMLGIIFIAATLVFLILFLTNGMFFNWVFARHHNVMSWYIRPLFILPIIIFAFKRSFAGISISVFALFTSMFWFPAPEISSAQVISFLQYEMEYLKGVWSVPKIIMSLSVPIFFIALILAAWKRNWKWLIGIIVSAAVLKILWSIAFSGEAGMSILKPAIAGLVICIGALYYYKKRHKSDGK